MTLGRSAWLVGVALLVLVVNVAVSVLYMVVYGHIIDPGHEEQYYQDHIKVAAPYCSIVAGIPLMFLAGWWGGWWEGEFAVKAALTVWLAYALIDFIVLLAAGPTRITVLFAVSILTKFARSTSARLSQVVGPNQRLKLSGAAGIALFVVLFSTITR